MNLIAIEPPKTVTSDEDFLEQIEYLDLRLKNEYIPYMHIDNTLNRRIVSFQGNKDVPFYRWYKYKEGFSAHLVDYYINRYGVNKIKKI